MIDVDFNCNLLNSLKSIYLISYFPVERPDKIDNLKLSQIESRNVQLIWVPPYTGNSFIISYQIECKEKGKTWETQDKIAHNVPGTENSYIIRGLNPITSYEIRMRCENNLGASDYSDVHQFSTSEEGIVKNCITYPIMSLHISNIIFHLFDSIPFHSITFHYITLHFIPFTLSITFDFSTQWSSNKRSSVSIKCKIITSDLASTKT